MIRRPANPDDAPLTVPERKTWTSYPEDAPPVGDDFMVERPKLLDVRTPW